MSKKFIFVIFLFLIKHVIYTQENNSTIRSIKFEGLKRTRITTLENIIKPIDVGSPYTSKTTNKIAQKLNEENLFKPFIYFYVTEDNNNVDIVVNVQDRWTLIPSVIFSVSDNSWFFGASILEKNFLGFNKELFAWGGYGSTGWNTKIQYKDKRFFNDNIDMHASVNGGESEHVDMDLINNEFIRSYKNAFVKTDISFLFSVLDVFKIGAGLKHDIFWNIKDNLNVTPLHNINSLGIYGSIEFKKYNYEYPFEEGVAVRINGGYQFSLIDSSPGYYSISGEVNSALILTPIQRIGGGLFAGYGDMPAQTEFRIAGLIGRYTLPQTFIAADYYASMIGFYELIFIDLALPNSIPFGRLGFQIFYEGGIYGSDVLDFSYHHGPGIALLTYLNNISMPPIELRLGWNIVNSELYFRFGVFRYL